MDKALEWLSGNILQILVILTIFIQITPIKWNPITSFLSWFGKLITADITQQVNKIETTVQSLQSEVRSNEKDRIRWEILDFANSCRNGRRHTKDEFDHIIDLNSKYETLLEITNDKNGVYGKEYKYIEELYDERQKKNDFL